MYIQKKGKNMDKDETQKKCTNDELEIVLENACSCEQMENVTQTVPDEFFYNTCDCTDCDCLNENGEVAEDFCHCGYMTNPLGMSYDSLSFSCDSSKALQ